MRVFEILGPMLLLKVGLQVFKAYHFFEYAMYEMLDTLLLGENVCPC